MGQEHLKGATLERRPFDPSRGRSDSLRSWDHDHCEFCWAKFMPAETAYDSSVLTEGYATEDGRWVCAECLADFRAEFDWTVVEPEAD